MNIQFAIQEGSAETFTTVKEQVLILPLKTIIFALSLGQNKQENDRREETRHMPDTDTRTCYGDSGRDNHTDNIQTYGIVHPSRAVHYRS